jgi:hypothetical protein
LCRDAVDDGATGLMTHDGTFVQVTALVVKDPRAAK